MKISCCTLALLALLPVETMAREKPLVIHVSYADLDLRSEAGIKLFDRRLANAARAVCPDIRGSADTARQFAARRCVQAKMAELAPQRDRILAAHAASSRPADAR